MPYYCPRKVGDLSTDDYVLEWESEEEEADFRDYAQEKKDAITRRIDYVKCRGRSWNVRFPKKKSNLKSSDRMTVFDFIKKSFASDFQPRLDRLKRMEYPNPLELASDLLYFEEMSEGEEYILILELFLEGVEKLKGALAQANREGYKKLVQIRKLKEKITKLEKGIIISPNSGGPMASIGVNDSVSGLSEEIWKQIFEHASADSMDLWNCSKVCILFRKFLHPHNTVVLFNEVFPHLFKLLEVKENLDCRLVCRAWNQGVDAFFENPSSFRSYPYWDSELLLPPFSNPWEEKLVDGWYRPEHCAYDRDGRNSGTLMERIMADESRTRNPLIGRYLSLNGNSRYADPSNLKECDPASLEKFLETYGCQIFYLNFNWDMENRNGIALSLRLFSNLRTLILDGYRRPALDIEEAYLAPHLDTIIMGKYVVSRGLELNTTHQLVEILLGRHHLQLQTLQVGLEIWNRVSNLDWPRLSTLHLIGGFNMEDSESLLQSALPNLRKLRFCPDLIPHNKVLELIKGLSQTSRLSIVRFDGLAWSKMDPNPALAICAPESLTTLELGYCYKKILSYSFLLHFPFLQNLNLHCWNEGGRRRRRSWDSCSDYGMFDPLTIMERRWIDKWTKDRMRADAMKRREAAINAQLVEINQYAGRGTIHKSNIWKLLPRLKILTIGNHVYTRGGLEGDELISSNGFFNSTWKNRRELMRTTLLWEARIRELKMCLLPQANKEMVQKVDQVMQLSKKVAKLQNTLRQRQSSTSGTELERMPGKDPDSIFPDELWEMIID